MQRTMKITVEYEKGRITGGVKPFFGDEYLIELRHNGRLITATEADRTPASTFDSAVDRMIYRVREYIRNTQEVKS